MSWNNNYTVFHASTNPWGCFKTAKCKINQQESSRAGDTFITGCAPDKTAVFEHYFRSIVFVQPFQCLVWKHLRPEKKNITFTDKTHFAAGSVWATSCAASSARKASVVRCVQLQWRPTRSFLCLTFTRETSRSTQPHWCNRSPSNCHDLIHTVVLAVGVVDAVVVTGTTHVVYFHDRGQRRGFGGRSVRESTGVTGGRVTSSMLGGIWMVGLNHSRVSVGWLHVSVRCLRVNAANYFTGSAGFARGEGAVQWDSRRIDDVRSSSRIHDLHVAWVVKICDVRARPCTHVLRADVERKWRVGVLGPTWYEGWVLIGWQEWGVLTLVVTVFTQQGVLSVCSIRVDIFVLSVSVKKKTRYHHGSHRDDTKNLLISTTWVWETPEVVRVGTNLVWGHPKYSCSK